MRIVPRTLYQRLTNTHVFMSMRNNKKQVQHNFVIPTPARMWMMGDALAEFQLKLPLKVHPIPVSVPAPGLSTVPVPCPVVRQSAVHSCVGVVVLERFRQLAQMPGMHTCFTETQS